MGQTVSLPCDAYCQARPFIKAVLNGRLRVDNGRTECYRVRPLGRYLRLQTAIQDVRIARRSWLAPTGKTSEGSSVPNTTPFAIRQFEMMNSRAAVPLPPPTVYLNSSARKSNPSNIRRTSA